MSDFTKKKGECRECKQRTDFNLSVQIFDNGSRNFVWVCAGCGRKNPSGDRQLYIPAKVVEHYLPADKIDGLPVIMSGYVGRCARCGNRNCERHHWAPVGLFSREEADRWPQDYLCKDCHDQWHRLVTPQLVMPNG